MVQSFPKGSFVFIKIPTDKDGNLIFNRDEVNMYSVAYAIATVRPDLNLVLMPDKFVIQSYDDYLSVKRVFVKCLNILENIKEGGDTVKVDD